MIFLNPNDFEGCRSTVRIFGSGFTYQPSILHNYTVIRFGDSEGAIDWYFDNETNRDKAIEKIDKMCKHPEPLQQIADNLDNIESSL